MVKNKAPAFADLLLAIPELAVKDLPKRRAARIVRERADYVWLFGEAAHAPMARQKDSSVE